MLIHLPNIVWSFFIGLLLLLATLNSGNAYGKSQDEVPLPPRLVNSDSLPSKLNLNTTPTMTLKEAILLAIRQNPEIRIAEMQRVVDKFALAVARNQFMPQTTLSFQALYQNRAKPNYSALPTVSLLMPYGTQFNSSITHLVNNDSDPPIVTDANFSLTQPLLRGFGKDVTKAALYNAEDAEKINQLGFKNQIISIIVEVVNAFYQLVQAYNSLKVDQLSLKDSEDTLNQTLIKIKVGKAAPTDQIQQQSNVANRKLAISINQSSIQQNYQNLINLLGLDPNAKIKINETIERSTRPIPSLEASMKIALENNIAYKTAQLSFVQAERSLLLAKDAQKWQLNASLNLLKPIGYDGRQAVESRSLNFDLEVPIYDLARKQQLLSAQVQLEQAKVNREQQKRQLIATVTNAYNSIYFGQQQVVLSEDSVKLAEQALKVAKIKFNYGKVSTFELTSLQTALTTAQLSFIAQRIQYLSALEAFYQILGTTLEKWQITLTY